MESRCRARINRRPVVSTTRLRQRKEPLNFALGTGKPPSRLRKKDFRNLLYPSVVSPRGGELKEGSQFYRRVRREFSYTNRFFRTLLAVNISQRLARLSSSLSFSPPSRRAAAKSHRVPYQPPLPPPSKD